MPAEFDYDIFGTLETSDDSGAFSPGVVQFVKWAMATADRRYASLTIDYGATAGASFRLDKYLVGKCTMALTRELIADQKLSTEGMEPLEDGDFMRVIPARCFWVARHMQDGKMDGGEIIGPEILREEHEFQKAC